MTLKGLRIESGLKAYKIAEEIGVSREQFRNLENGLYKIDNRKIEKLCEVYRKTKSEIIEAIGEGNISDRKWEKVQWAFVKFNKKMGG